MYFTKLNNEITKPFWLENQLAWWISVSLLQPLLLLLSLLLISIWWTIWQDGGNRAGQYGSLKVFCEVEIWLSITMVATTSLLTESRGLTRLFLSAPKDPDAEANIKQHLESAKTVPPSAVTFMDSDNEPKGHLLILDGRVIDANGRTAACAVSALMSAYYVLALEYQHGVYTHEWYLAYVLFSTLDITCPNKEWNVTSSTRTRSRNMARLNTNEFRDENDWRMERSSPGPYFYGSFLVEDIMFHSVLCTHNVQYAERYARQTSLKYVSRLPIEGGDSVHKWWAPAILDEGHCSDHQST